MKIDFKPEELITKGNKCYPVVGGRLRVAHEENKALSIQTEQVQFEALSHAMVKASIGSEKDQYSAYGVASSSKDERLVDSLLELSETKAIAGAIRFASDGLEYTGSKELPEDHGVSRPVNPHLFQLRPKPSNPEEMASLPQISAIQKICRSHNWKIPEALRRILKLEGIESPEQLTKQQASLVIRRMKEALAA